MPMSLGKMTVIEGLAPWSAVRNPPLTQNTPGIPCVRIPGLVLPSQDEKSIKKQLGDHRALWV